MSTYLQVTVRVCFLHLWCLIHYQGAIANGIPLCCIVGVQVSPAEIKSAVSEVITGNKDLLMEERYRVNGKISSSPLYITNDYFLISCAS